MESYMLRTKSLNYNHVDIKTKLYEYRRSKQNNF